MIVARQIFFEGRVQGVGFRFTAKQIARGFEVTGWVKNLPDGRVEMQAQGEPEEVKAFLAEIRESSLAGHIQAMQEHVVPVNPGQRGFLIEF